MFERLKEIREKNHITAQKMSEILGLKTEAAYYKKENGTIRFSLKDAEKISNYLNMSVEEIFFDSEVSKTETKSS